MPLTISEVAKDSIEKVLKLGYLGVMFTNFTLDLSEDTIKALIDYTKEYSKTEGQALEVKTLRRVDNGEDIIESIKREKREKPGTIFVLVNYWGLQSIDEVIMGNTNRPRREQFYELNLANCFDTKPHTSSPELPSYS